MKKIINIALIATALAIINPLHAKRVPTIKVKPHEKEMFVDTKTLKQAETPEEKKEAAENLAKDIANDPVAFLLLQKAEVLAEIATTKNDIKKKGGYFGYLFVNEELQLLQEELQELEEELKDIEEDLIKLGATQPEKVMNLKKWAVGTLITAVGIGIALQLAGYDVTGTLMTGAGAIAGKVGSALKTGWEYVPSFRPSTETVLDVLTKASHIAVTGFSTVGTFLTAYNYYEKLNDIIALMNADPDADQEILQKAKKDRDALETQMAAYGKKNPEKRDLVMRLEELKKNNPAEYTQLVKTLQQ